VAFVDATHVCRSANSSLKKEMKKLEHELDKARREVSSTNVAMRSLKTEVKGLREVMIAIIHYQDRHYYLRELT
jgi:predicted  nucleic acid-binding Zn-ribbon protein